MDEYNYFKHLNALNSSFCLDWAAEYVIKNIKIITFSDMSRAQNTSFLMNIELDFHCCYCHNKKVFIVILLQQNFIRQYAHVYLPSCWNEHDLIVGTRFCVIIIWTAALKRVEYCKFLNTVRCWHLPAVAHNELEMGN